MINVQAVFLLRLEGGLGANDKQIYYFPMFDTKRPLTIMCGATFKHGRCEICCSRLARTGTSGSPQNAQKGGNLYPAPDRSIPAIPDPSYKI